MQILLIRHGQSEADLLHVHEGRADYPLTERGREQAQKMALRVEKEFPPQQVFASTLKRASETAAILAETLGCPVEYLPELQERNNGNLAGRPEADVSYPWDLRPHERLGETGETLFEFGARAAQALSLITAEAERKGLERIAIVSHGWMITHLFMSYLGMPMAEDCYLLTGDTGIHLLETNARGKVVRFTNSLSHLA